MTPPCQSQTGKPFIHPKGYVCHRAITPPRIDGKLDDVAWADAAWTDDFLDIEGDAKPAPRFRTRAKMLWDDECFYVGAELIEPHVWATLTERDSVIFNDNDFEVFIDPDGDNHQYYEFEINALGTFWDLLLIKPYIAGGPAVNGWDIRGVRSAVYVDGTLNDPRDIDRGWSVEIAFPWSALRECADKQTSPPKDGDQWRVNFSRVQWRHELRDGKYAKIAGQKEDNWVWSPQGLIDMHRPWMWGYVQFSTGAPGSARFLPDALLPALHAASDCCGGARVA
ncbi:MAG: carbohydrate-binding family 9-like protein [Phycisphaerales bacterium]|nr:carbohydrate-binding family 9-like protein [Phycisphaerales bacterium]